MALKVLNGLDMTSTPIDNLPDAVSPQQPITKAQYDAGLDGRSWKTPVRAASTANLTLSGTQTVDGVALIALDRILVKDQSTGADNGIYVVSAGAWSRATDANTAAEIFQATMFVSEGTTNADKQFTLATNNPITLGTTSLSFIQSGSGTTYTGGNGITVTGSVIAVDAAVVARKAAANIGNGSATSFNVTHNLGSSDCTVQLKEISSKKYMQADYEEVDTNTTKVTFAVAPTTNQYRVIITG
jgi:phage-related tail fiber protein